MRVYIFILSLVLSLIVSTKIFADQLPKLIVRCNQTDFNLCGYIDADIWNHQSREVFIIEPKFEHAKDFSNGLAAVRINGKFGYIDKTGQVIIAPLFDRAGAFDQGLAVAGTNKAYGIIDIAGNYIVDPIFSHAIIYSNDIILGGSIDNVKYGYISYDNSTIDNARVYSLSTGWLTDQSYKFERFDDAKHDLIWAQNSQGKPGTWDDKYGLMRLDGRWLIEPVYDYVTPLKHNRAVISKTIGNNTSYGAIDRHGKQVIPFKFEYLTHWDENFLAAGQGKYPNRKRGLVSFDGQLLANRYFDEIQADTILGPDHPAQDFYSVKDGETWKTLTKDGQLLSDQRIGQAF